VSARWTDQLTRRGSRRVGPALTGTRACAGLYGAGSTARTRRAVSQQVPDPPSCVLPAIDALRSSPWTRAGGLTLWGSGQPRAPIRTAPDRLSPRPGPEPSLEFGRGGHPGLARARVRKVRFDRPHSMNKRFAAACQTMSDRDPSGELASATSSPTALVGSDELRGCHHVPFDSAL
jgi:hypothetical protein